MWVKTISFHKNSSLCDMVCEEHSTTKYIENNVDVIISKQFLRNKIMNKLIIFFFLVISIPTTSHSQSIIGLNFGCSIDSIYHTVTERYGKEMVSPMRGGIVPGYPMANVDSIIIVKEHIIMFDNQPKTAKSTLLSFQLNNKNRLSLYQVCFLVTELSADWGDILDRIYTSYFDYITPNYPKDFEVFYNEYGLKCFRFGKEKYTKGTWYGLYNVVKSSNGYKILLIYSVPQR